MNLDTIIDHLTSPEAAEYLRRSVRTLARMRAEGRGPNYHQEGGRVLYPLSALSEWLASHVKTPPREALPTARVYRRANSLALSSTQAEARTEGTKGRASVSGRGL